MFSKGLKEPTKKDYISYFEDLESKGFIIDVYNENMSLEEIKIIYNYVKNKICSTFFTDEELKEDLRRK